MNDLLKQSLGFDWLMQDRSFDSYPPHNIYRTKDEGGEDRYVIAMAVAG